MTEGTCLHMSLDLLARGIAYSYGLLHLAICAASALWSGDLWRRHDKEEEQSLRQGKRIDGHILFYKAF